MKIDFLARESQYADHMIPIYRELRDSAGDFFVPVLLREHMEKAGIEPHPVLGNHSYNLVLDSRNPILVASHRDLQTAYMTNPKRPIILMEHGVGLVFPGNASYAGNIGYRKHAALTLAPNKIVYEKTKSVLPEMPQVIIGTPKLDKWAGRMQERHEMSMKPTVCISFHWDGGGVAPEAGNAFEHYKGMLEDLNDSWAFKLVAHAHPRAASAMRFYYTQRGIPFIDSFEEVMETADVYVNDCSSTMYEFLVTGKPVVILNSPRFRRHVNFGIRFWDYTSIGRQVDDPKNLMGAIVDTIMDPEKYRFQREKTVEDLYPYLGNSSKMAVEAIFRHLETGS